jgi:hypothetical protein
MMMVIVRSNFATAPAYTFFSAIGIAATVIFWLGQRVLTLVADHAA